MNVTKLHAAVIAALAGTAALTSLGTLGAQLYPYRVVISVGFIAIKNRVDAVGVIMLEPSGAV